MRGKARAQTPALAPNLGCKLHDLSQVPKLLALVFPHPHHGDKQKQQFPVATVTVHGANTSTVLGRGDWQGNSLHAGSVMRTPFSPSARHKAMCLSCHTLLLSCPALHRLRKLQNRVAEQKHHAQSPHRTQGWLSPVIHSKCCPETRHRHQVEKKNPAGYC